MMEAFKSLNLGISFLLELCMLLSLGYWGYQAQQNFIWKYLLAIGMPLLAAVLWGIFAAPNSSYRLKASLRLIFETGVFTVTAFALYRAGHAHLAIVFGAMIVINQTLVFVWKQ